MRIRRIASALVSVLCSLFLAEGATRLLLAWPWVFDRIQGYDDASGRLRFVARHPGPTPMSYTFDVYDSLRGWALAPDLDSLPVYGRKVLSTNSRGIRGRAEYDYTRRPGTCRIVALGDSFTFGEEVSDQETWPNMLATLLPQCEVLNLGVHGYGHDQMLLYYRAEGAKYRPDLVILGYVQADTERNPRWFTDYAKPRLVPTGAGLRLQNVPVPTPEQVMAREWLRPKLVDLITMLAARTRERLGFGTIQKQQVAWRILDDLVRDVRKVGARPVFVYLPARQELVDLRAVLSPAEQQLGRYCQSRAVSCVFARPRFREAAARGMIFPTTHHWGADGHRLVAEVVEKFLVDRGLIPRGR